MTPQQIDEAKKYNLHQAPSPFFCPVQRVLIQPSQESGVRWIALMQEYLDDPWESRHGDPDKRLEIDGKLGPKTREAIESRYGRLSSAVDFDTTHPMPLLVSYWGYDLAFSWGNTDWPEKDAQWEAFTSGGLWQHGMLRLVTGWNPRTGTFSRTPRDWASIDELTLGFPHYWADTAPGFLSRFVNALFPLAVIAWGEETAEKMRSEDWIRSQIDVKKGKRSHQAKYNWLLTGWWHVGNNEDAMRWQSEDWLERYHRYTKRVLVNMRWVRKIRNAEGGRILAGIMRMVNSAGARGTTQILQSAQKRCSSEDPLEILENAYLTAKEDGGYGHEDRWEVLMTWDEFQGPMKLEE